MVVPQKSETNLADAVNQKARRRRRTLFKKASEYSSECGADIHIVLRMKKSGKIFILTSNSEGWPLSQNQLMSYHPTPIHTSPESP
ncbi:Transcription factor, MADS-box [Penicillium camemberti]|uniref:Transcription factor, MADS-box n=1 Tax=Penicillium camemberti (strain FM 013) TaxID=1429867 RepID=A0A0G4PVE5_PENC3|nr:Transcription factor, MADS-box [Penicillium camemberti]